MTKLTVSSTINAPIDVVYRAMRDPQHITHRCFASDDRCCPHATGSEPVVGQTFSTRMEAKDASFGFDMTGQYTHVDPTKSFSYTMGSYERDDDFVDAGRVVDVTFEQIGDNLTQVTETFDAEDIHDLDMQTAGRQAILDNFKKYVEEL